MFQKIFFSLIMFFIFPCVVLASDLSVTKDSVLFSNKRPISGEKVRIYITVDNFGQHDSRASVKFFIDGVLISTQPITVLSNKNSAVFVDWTPNEGYYKIEAQVVDIDPSDDNTGNNSVIVSDFLVDLDTDNDGIFDTEDLDDDNDGVDDGVERINGTNPMVADTDGDGAIDGIDAFPLDPKEKFDSDNDGIGNNSDSDNDNDGVLNGDDPAPFDPNITGKEINASSFPQNESQNQPQTTQENVSSKENQQNLNQNIISEEQTSSENSEHKIEEVTYTFPDESEAEYEIEVMIAKSKKGWKKFEFDVLGTNDSYIYLWDFGDGKMSQTKNPGHEFPSSGSYEVIVMVSDGSGGIGKYVEKIEIGFWNIGNPWVIFMISFLGVFGFILIAYIIFQAIMSKKKK